MKGTKLLLSSIAALILCSLPARAETAALKYHPYFKARDRATGRWMSIKGSPRAVTMADGALALELFDAASTTTLDVDMLAVEPDYFGEPPAEKALRLKKELGLAMAPELESLLRDPKRRDQACRRIEFELPYGGERTRMTIADIAVDGSAEVAIDSIPARYMVAGTLTPKFFRVSADKFDPAALEKAGYSFEPSIYGGTTARQLAGILDAKVGGSLAAVSWKAARLKDIGLKLESDDLTVNQVYRFGGRTYFATAGGFVESKVGRVYRVDPDGTVTKIYQGPGRLLLAMPNPKRPGVLLISEEGYPKGDPRFQSLFEKDLATGKETVVPFPIRARKGNPELYATSGRYDSDGNIILKRYGFPNEGGGLWWLDAGDYDHKKQLVSWDHMLSWIPLDASETGTYYPSVPSPGRVAITGKEVEDQFSMTINEADVAGAGKDVEVSGVHRLGKLVGWNPQVLGHSELQDGKYAVQVQVPYDFDTFMARGSEAIYEVEISSPAR